MDEVMEEKKTVKQFLEETEAEQYKILFTIEIDTDTLTPRLGGFMCVPWLQVFKDMDRGKLTTLNHLTDGLIGEAVHEVASFIRFSKLRPTFDNKCKGPFVVLTDFRVTHSQFADYIDSLSAPAVLEKFVNNPKAKLGVGGITFNGRLGK